MSQPPINEENQLSLLFKQFQGVAQAEPGHGTTPSIQYNAETIAKLNSIYSSSVFINPVPKELQKNVGQMKNDNNNYNDTTWQSGPTGTVWNQTIGKTPVKDATGTDIAYLHFYKRVYLKSTGNDNSWWLPEQSTPSKWSSSTNRLRNMIPWLYNDTNASMFTPIIEYWDPNFGSGGGWRTVGLQNQNSGWVIDYASGLVVFYNERTTLKNTYGFDQSAPDTNEKARPRISFVRYEGEFLEDAIRNGTIGGGGGASQVGNCDNSGQVVAGTLFDASAILFNETQFDISDNSGNAIINIANAAFESDISRYFFDIPPAPYSGDISKNNSAVAAINMTWQLPQSDRTSVPLGKTTHYIDGIADVSNANVGYLPFFKELRIDALEVSDPSKNPTNNNDWDAIDTNNNQQQPFFPPSLTSATMHADGTSGGSNYTLSGTIYPFTQLETDQVLETGKTYQFRIYLTNDASGSVIDTTYGHTTPWNYYYLPEGSGGQIELGSFGPPTAPTGAEIFNNQTIYDAVSVDISNQDTNGADASANNIGWPIPNNFDLNVRFGGDVDGVPDPSNIAKQMPNIRSQLQDSSAEILGPYGKNGRLLIADIFTATTDLSSSSTNWKWYPETKYTLSNVYMQNDTVDFSDQIASYSGDSSCNTGVPSRQDLNISTTRLQPNTTNPLQIDETTNTTIAVKTYAYPQFDASVSSPDLSINDIFFITNNDVVDFGINPIIIQHFGPWANNSDKGGGSVGIDSSGVNLTKYEMSIQDHTSAQVISSETTSSMLGFLDVSGIDYTGTNFTLSAEAIDRAGAPTKGYYTDVTIKKSEMIDICLNNVPDICNNFYKPYTVAIQDICGNDKLNKLTGPFSLARTPLQDISYNLPTSLNASPTLDFRFFGQALPTLNNITLPSHTYDISGIDDYWRRSLLLATTRSIYNNSSPLENGTNTMEPVDVSWNIFTGNTKTVNPSIVIEPSRIWDISSESDSKRYSRNVLSTPQFAVYISGDNNVARTPAEISGNYPITFGGNTNHLFWDYTWDENPNGTLPLSTPSGFFSYSSGSPTPDFSTRFVFLEAQGNLTGATITSAGAALQHWPNKMPTNQLLWANGAFRGAGITSVNKNNPYVDFSSNYYNPQVTINGFTRLALEDYSTDKLIGVGINEVFQQPFDGWWDNVNSPSAPLQVSEKAKYITFRTWMPPVDRLNGSSTTNTQGYSLIVKDSSNIDINHITSTSSVGDGYWVYHVEIPPVSPATFTAFSGQKVAGPSNGCYASSIDGYKVSNTVPSLGATAQAQTNLTQVEISIGLTIGSQKDIASVEIEWVAN